MPPVCYFASYHKSPPRSRRRRRQQKEYKNNEQPPPPASNCFLQGLRFLSGRHKVEIRDDVFSVHDQYNTLGDMFKVKDF